MKQWILDALAGLSGLPGGWYAGLFVVIVGFGAAVFWAWRLYTRRATAWNVIGFVCTLAALMQMAWASGNIL